jgi:RND family efflux transporter MFP subunit
MLLALAIGGFYLWSQRVPANATGERPLVVAAVRSTLNVTVTERGNLEAVKTVDGVCEVSGRDNKIVFIVPEGTEVKAGEVVVRFDTAEIDRNIAQQQIEVSQAEGKVRAAEQEVEVQRNKGESEIAEAALELTLADLDLKKYTQGEYKVELADLKGQIALAEADLDQAKEELDNFRTLVKKGFRSPAQLRYVEQGVSKAEYYLERDKEKLGVLEKYNYQRKLTEYTGKRDQAVKKIARTEKSTKAQLTKFASEFEAAKAKLELEKERLEKLLAEKEKCIIKAPQPGVVAYANESWYESSRQIREGAMVYYRQKIFSLPDMNTMQVKVNVHESVIKKVEPGQKAEVRVDAFPNVLLDGTVKTVSPLADSTRSWTRGGVKEYTTIVNIDRLPDVDLKPGMTAEVKIQVNEITGVILVPVQAVTERDRQHYVYVGNTEGFDRRAVKVGESNEKFVEIVDGLAEGEEVALDARSRAVADFENQPIAPAPDRPVDRQSAGKVTPVLSIGG